MLADCGLGFGIMLSIRSKYRQEMEAGETTSGWTVSR